MNLVEKFEDNDFGVCRILFSRALKSEHVCLFASHTIMPFLPEYVYYYLDELKKLNFSLVFISSSKISDTDLAKLVKIADLIVEKENKGTDFGAWCAVLRQLDYGKKFKSLYLCNDSVFGPLKPLGSIVNNFYSGNRDVLGITDSHQGAGYHIQSYFIGLKSAVLKSEIWESFWKEMKLHKDKRKVIEYYEIGLTRKLINAGFKHLIWSDWLKKIDFNYILQKVSRSDELRLRWLNRVLYERNNIILDINPSSFLWKELIVECRSPFIKRELFIYNQLYEEFEVEKEWERILNQHTNYPSLLIKLFLIEYLFFKTIKQHLKEILNADISFYALRLKSEVCEKNGCYDNTVLFGILHSILEPLDYVPDSAVSHGFKQLDILKIKYFPIQFSSDKGDDISICTLLYFNYDIFSFDQEQLIRLKTAIKKTPNAIIIVPDRGSQAIVASLISLRSERILLEQDFFSPIENSKIVNYFKKLFFAERHNELAIFRRLSLSEVVIDVLEGKNKIGFIKSKPELNQVIDGSGMYNSDYYTSREDYLQYLAIKEKYFQLYENTPMWYKKVGQIIKVFKGKKRFSFNWIDKDKKDIYRPTTSDIMHWYYIQYEVLPSWYKKFGKLVAKKKSNI